MTGRVLRLVDLEDVRGAARPRAGSSEKTRAIQEKARDEVELLATALEVKQAALATEKRVLEEAFLRLAQRDKGRAARGPLSSDDYRAGMQVVKVARARVAEREAEWHESAVRLKQAKRRLATLEATPARPAADTDERPRDPERKPESLRKETEEPHQAPRPEKAK